MMHSLPRNGMNRGERALNLATSLHFSLLFLQWAKTVKVKRLFAEKERRRERGREGRRQSKCEPQQEDLGLCWGSPGDRWYQLGLTHLYCGKKEAFSSVRPAFPLNGDHAGCNGKVRVYLKWKCSKPSATAMKKEVTDQWSSNYGPTKIENGQFKKKTKKKQ